MLKKVALSMMVAFGAVGVASAHTTSLGYVPGANFGEVTFWAGHYNHGGIPGLQGSGRLVGVDVTYDSGVIPFSIGVVTTKPAGLVDGTNNFFWGPAPYPFGLTTDPNLFGGVVHWEGLTVSGLVAGTYDFTIADDARTTEEWANLVQVGGEFASVRLVLTGRDIGGGDVPEPSALALLGLGLTGLFAARRAKRA